MELRARHIVEGFLSGMHRSPYFGQIGRVSPAPRSTPWATTCGTSIGRSGPSRTSTSSSSTRKRPTCACTLLVDVSGSMLYGRGPMNKYEYASTAAVSLAYLLLRQQDAVGCVAFDQTTRATTPLRSKRNHLMSIIAALDNSRPAQKTDLFQILRGAAESFPRRGMMVIFSDLLADRPSFLKGIRLLRQRGHDVMVLHVMDDDELDFPFNGPTRFEGLELPEHLACNPRALREGYMEALKVFLDEVRLGCVRNSVDYQLIRTSEPLDAALATFLSRRLALERRA